MRTLGWLSTCSVNVCPFSMEKVLLRSMSFVVTSAVSKPFGKGMTSNTSHTALLLLAPPEPLFLSLALPALSSALFLPRLLRSALFLSLFLLFRHSLTISFLHLLLLKVCLLKVVSTEETTSRPTSQLKTLLSGTGIVRRFSPTPCVFWSWNLLVPSSPAPWLPSFCLLPALSSAARQSIQPDTFLVLHCCR